jgi:hypothetical protein
MAHDAVAPNHQDQKQGQPPGRGGPEEQRKSFEEGEEAAQQRRQRRSQDEGGARERGDGDGSHIDPIGRRESRARQLQEGEAIEYERDDAEIEHTADQIHHEAEE